MSVTSTIILTAIMIIFLIVFKCSYELAKEKNVAVYQGHYQLTICRINLVVKNIKLGLQSYKYKTWVTNIKLGLSNHKVKASKFFNTDIHKIQKSKLDKAFEFFFFFFFFLRFLLAVIFFMPWEWLYLIWKNFLFVFFFIIHITICIEKSKIGHIYSFWRYVWLNNPEAWLENSDIIQGLITF